MVIHSKGLVPGVFHPQHIHRTAHGDHFSPTLKEADKDGDGIITNEEGMGEYGVIFFPLTTSGGATATPQMRSTPSGCRSPTQGAESTTNEPSPKRYFLTAYWTTCPRCTS